MKPAALRFWSCSLRFGAAATKQGSALACALAMSLAATGAWGQEKQYGTGPGALETAQTIQNTGGDRAKVATNESTGEPQTPVTASAGSEGSTPSNPEPKTWALMGAGLIAAAMIRRRMERR